MRLSVLLLLTLSIAACDQDTATTSAPNERATAAPASAVSADPMPQHTESTVPNIADYAGACPKDWGIVAGATQTHVEQFIQNYFAVPANSPGPMYSAIDSFSAPDGRTLIKAGTYKMLDPIVDQEMVAEFAAGLMTQCGSRLRCENDPERWVASCD